MAKALFIVHWPGQDVYACMEHAAQLEKIANFMGVTNLAMTVTKDDVECTNCLNVRRKEASNG